MPKMYKINTHGIALTPVSSLNKVMPSILKNFDVVGIHDDKTKDYNPYSIFFIEGDLDINRPNYIDLFNKYPTIYIIENDLKREFKVLRIPKYFIQADKKYSLTEINDKIKINNSTIKMPNKSEFLMEKAAFIQWHGYNTPNAKDISITPLHGTGYPHINLKDKSPLNIFNLWKISSYMLIWEFNVLNRATKYMDNLSSNTSQPSAYKDSFEYWKNRQIIINMEHPLLFQEGFYIRDFTIDLDQLYTEMCEDFLYVMLNIILAKSIVDEININYYQGSLGSEFESKIKSIIYLHYQKYEEYYICLNSIRISNIENYISVSELKKFSI